ncbi:hypothetical protein V6N11_047049 [Hibiscus sabdariffa]|uniref:Uncharacterized protein n=2 Tax=Hibiscus sabdariffa TaxID=183260 RepID=A0ABR2D1X6_9ROSI
MVYVTCIAWKVETIDHVLRSCPKAMQVWQQLIHYEIWQDFMSCKSSALSGHTIVDSIKSLLQLDWKISPQHISRSQNRVADALIVTAQGKPVGEWIYDAPPAYVKDMLQHEC